jgi:hypothetical protein
MRIAERLARLEQVQSNDPRMTAAEIEAAATCYEDELISDGSPGGRSVADALTSWRSLVAATSEPWLQRIYAGMSPADLYA